MLVRNIPLDQIDKNPWNPNSMGGPSFDRLVKEIRDVGMIDPVQVVPWHGRFRLIGGEHRAEAMRVLGHTEVPCVVLDEERWQDEDLQKLVTVRLNVLKGKLDPTRFTALYDEMAKKHGESALQEAFAFTNEKAWADTMSSIKRGLAKAGLSKGAQQKFEKATREMRSIEDLSMILNQIFAENGDTVNLSYMVFTYGSKEHVYVAMDDQLRAVMKKITNHCRASGTDLNDIMAPALKEAASKLRSLKSKEVDVGNVDEEKVDF